MATSAPPDVPSRVRQLATQLADPKPMRRGSLSERTIKCSKPGCACAQDPKARHGPYHSLTHAVGSKTRSRFLTDEQAGLVRQQIDTGREFRGPSGCLVGGMRNLGRRSIGRLGSLLRGG